MSQLIHARIESASTPHELVFHARNNSPLPVEALEPLAKEKPIFEVRDMISALQMSLASCEELLV